MLKPQTMRLTCAVRRAIIHFLLKILLLIGIQEEVTGQGTEIDIVGVVESHVALEIICFTMRRTAFLFVGNTTGLDKTIPDVVSLEFVGGNNARVPVLPADRVVK